MLVAGDITDTALGRSNKKVSTGLFASHSTHTPAHTVRQLLLLLTRVLLPLLLLQLLDDVTQLMQLGVVVALQQA
jgi:hypothetical protein